MSIVVFSHGHRDFSKGGAETAAYNLFQGYLETGLDAHLFCRSDSNVGWGALTKYRDNEYLYYTELYEYEYYLNRNDGQSFELIVEKLKELNPSVIHFHHFFFFGVDFISYLKSEFPEVRFILTLHEFLALCPNDGQMIKPSGQLCYSASELECSKCIGSSISRVSIRAHTYKRLLSKFDDLISPSQFLKERYVSWGVEDKNFHVIENGQIIPDLVDRVNLGSKIRFSFFGQINPYKGVDVLLEAFSMLKKRERKKVTLNIYGANLEKQSAEFQKSIEALREETKGLVNFKGSYQPEQLTGLMSQNDVLIIPSVWWENSPMVIQEAFSHGMPVVCSNIGGMKEKIIDGVNGLHFNVADPDSLSDVVRRLIADETLLPALKTGITPPKSCKCIASDHIELLEIPII